jgi:hypothetical protein
MERRRCVQRPILITAILAGASIPASAAPSAADAAAAPPPARNVQLGIAGGPCQRLDVHPAGPRETVGPKKLDELPPAALYLTVLRGTDGCYEPVIVRRGYGAMTDPAQSRERARPRR